MTESASLPDTVKGHWVERYSPAWFLPYARMARLERPVGWQLLLWPCWWSLALASDAAGYAIPNPWHWLLFLIGAVAMRGAGCVFNDIVDKDLDAQVYRTRGRPIPSGQVTRRQAAVFMVILSLIGLAVLLQFNRFTIIMGLCSLLVVAIYPFMKRITYWPQFVLGLAFSWGAFLGWTSVFGALAWPALLIYAGSILWTIFYDTIYAHQDKEDDVLVGIKSTALLFGPRTKPILSAFATATVAVLALATYLAGVGPLAFLGLGGFAAHLAWQIKVLDIAEPMVCLKLFRSNWHAGWIFFLGIVADGLVRNAGLF
ncbi:4-hydroxybenzoate octaprenyltransferase [Amorphus orientalis]|uniref:4-hydroxybenzoate octaprenyltransferase n=1 Tax=Amorphus orientalis TaxID=649198 RepID=A0AAE3VRN3_9HYPH|nr:4-hydroxybenzoate octaprenyltransferase [Amorphus orientalis]MDQ0316728.1 4-hydroxybenzoate polyprenyltransferase [Amorphus orientalis]